MTKIKDKIKALQRKYCVIASHPSGLQCKCIEGAIGHYNDELEELIAESNREYGAELLERLDTILREAYDKDYYRENGMSDARTLLKSLKSQIEKENGNDK